MRDSERRGGEDAAALAPALAAIGDAGQDAPALEQAQPEPPPASLPRGPLARQVWLLALPMLGEQAGNFTIGMVDTYLAGRVSMEATAAVGTAAYVGWFAGLTMMLICTGVAAIVSRAFGANDRATANRTMNQSLLMMAVVGGLTTLIAWLAAPAFAELLAQTPEAKRLFAMYLRIDSLGYLGFSMLSVVNTVLRAAGDTRTPMLLMLVVNAVNAVVSAALVFGWFGPPMGVAGIAIGTVLARWAGGLLALARIGAGVRGLRVRLAELRPDLALTWRMLRIGIPGAIEAGLMATAQVLFIKIVAETAQGDAGTANYSAHMIAVRMEAITYLPAMAWMTAAATCVGQYLGARQLQAARRAAHAAALQAGALTALVGIGFVLFAEPIYALLSGEAQVRAAGAPAFRILGVFQPILCLGIIYNGALRGAGDTRFTLLVSLICGFAVRVPIAYVFGVVLGGGLIGAWVGMWSDNCVRLTLALVRYVRGGWMRVSV